VQAEMRQWSETTSIVARFLAADPERP
jgi:hypothetical protein